MTISVSNVGKMVHYFRKQSGLTQYQLAQLAGVGKTVVFDIEKGKVTIQFNNLLKVLEVLNIQVKLTPPFPQPMGPESCDK